VIDVRGLRVGHAATHISRLLIGKHKPSFNPAGTTPTPPLPSPEDAPPPTLQPRALAVDGGDYVVVTNADKVTLTGDKWKKKLYRWHTGYPGGLKEVKAQDMLYKHPDSLIRRAVSKMVLLASSSSCCCCCCFSLDSPLWLLMPVLCADCSCPKTSCGGTG